MNVGPNILVPCPYGECAFKNPAGRCTILTDVSFPDGVCHFQKEKKAGGNLYDMGTPNKSKKKSEVMNRRQMIEKMWRSGMTKEEIAERCGVRPNTVKRHLELLGLQR